MMEVVNVSDHSKVVSPRDSDWQTNGAGHKVNVKFGFGALDTARLVDAARASDWKTAKTQHICQTEVREVNLKTVGQTHEVTDTIKTVACSVDQDKCVTKVKYDNYLDCRNSFI